MADYMILIGLIVESDDPEALAEQVQPIMKTVRATLSVIHGFDDDQQVGIYVLKLTPEQAQTIIDNPSEGYGCGQRRDRADT